MWGPVGSVGGVTMRVRERGRLGEEAEGAMAREGVGEIRKGEDEGSGGEGEGEEGEGEGEGERGGGEREGEGEREGILDIGSEADNEVAI